jgi:hypothetical protein
MENIYIPYGSLLSSTLLHFYLKKRKFNPLHSSSDVPDRTAPAWSSEVNNDRRSGKTETALFCLFLRISRARVTNFLKYIGTRVATLQLGRRHSIVDSL